jgi:hypothetical protein
MYNCKIIKTISFRLYKNERPHAPGGTTSPPDKTSISLKQAISGPRFMKLKMAGNPCLKGLSHEIDFKNFVENGQILVLIRAAAGF